MRDISELGFDNDKGLANLKLITEFERLVGAKLPDSYVRFLRQVNGGSPDVDCFYLEDGEEFSASTFYHLGLDPKDEFDLLGAYRAYNHTLPQGVLPIACDGGDNQICLDLRPNASHEVVVWDHEYGTLRPAAVTFESFLDSLFSPEEE